VIAKRGADAPSPAETAIASQSGGNFNRNTSQEDIMSIFNKEGRGIFGMSTGDGILGHNPVRTLDQLEPTSWPWGGLASATSSGLPQVDIAWQSGPDRNQPIIAWQPGPDRGQTVVALQSGPDRGGKQEAGQHETRASNVGGFIQSFNPLHSFMAFKLGMFGSSGTDGGEATSHTANTGESGQGNATHASGHGSQLGQETDSARHTGGMNHLGDPITTGEIDHGHYGSRDESGSERLNQSDASPSHGTDHLGDPITSGEFDESDVDGALFGWFDAADGVLTYYNANGQVIGTYPFKSGSTVSRMKVLTGMGQFRRACTSSTRSI
jgi:hypothetical protein